MSTLFTLLLFSLPLGVLTRFNVYQNAYFYLHDILVVLIFIIFIYKLLTKEIILPNKKLLNYFIAFLVVGFVSLLTNLRFLTAEQFTVSLLYLVRYALYGSLIFSVVALDQNYIKKINAKFIISGTLFVSLGFLQYFFYQDLRNLYYAGWDEHLYRLFSTFLDPNFAGIFLVFVLLLIFSNLLYILKNKNKHQFRLLSIMMFLNLVSIYLTRSRSAFIALVVGVVVLLAINKKTKLLIPVLILFVTGVVIFSDSRIENMNPLRFASSEARIESAQTAISVIEKNPIVGVGFNAYRYALERYGYIDKQTRYPSNADAGTDNSYLFVIATSGIVGFIVFMKFLWEVLALLRRNAKSSVIGIAALASFIALLINTLFINSLFYPLVMVWMFIMIGVTVSKKQ